MERQKFKVGDRVQFKEWDEMGKEFGFRIDGDINTKCLFREKMRHLCGTYATVADLIPFAGDHLVILCNFTTTGDTYWNITPDMLKPASAKKQEEPKKEVGTTTIPFVPKFEVGKKYILDGTMYKGVVIEITSLEIKNGRLYYLIKIVEEANENRRFIASCFEEGTLLANSLKLYEETLNKEPLKPKFKIGDRVKINSSCYRGLTGQYATVCYQCFDDILNTNVYKLKDFSICKELSAIFIKFKENELEFASDKKKEKVYKKHKTVATPYEPYTPNKTIVSHEIIGNTTYVTLSNGVKGIARCNPEDKFDAYTGLKLATERAYGIKTDNEPKPKFEIGKKYIMTGESQQKGDILQITDCVNTKYGLKYIFKVVKGEPYPCDHFYETSYIERSLKLERSLKPYEEPQVKEVKREAKKGEYIKLTRKDFSFNEIGDILKVDSVEKVASVYAKNHPLRHKNALFVNGENHLWHYTSYDYVVLENYKPQKADEKHDTSTKAVSHKLDTQTKFEIGKRYILNNIAYKGTILEITSIVRITNAPHRPIIRYGVKIIHKAHDFRPIDFFEEGSRLAIALKPFEGEYVKEVKRPAKAGEYIKLISPYYSFNEIGDIFKVYKASCGGLVEVYGYSHPRQEQFTKEQLNTLWGYLPQDYVVLESELLPYGDEIR